jgi:hypothetical protein
MTFNITTLHNIDIITTISHEQLVLYERLHYLTLQNYME